MNKGVPELYLLKQRWNNMEVKLLHYLLKVEK